MHASYRIFCVDCVTANVEKSCEDNESKKLRHSGGQGPVKQGSLRKALN